MSTCDRCGGGGVVHLQVGHEQAVAEVCRCKLPCPECQGAHFVFEEQDGYDVAVPCGCQGLVSRVHLFNEALIPAGYGEKTVPGFVDQGGGNQGEIKIKLARYYSQFELETSRGLVLAGDTGVGKTHLVCGLLHYFTLELGIRCRFVDFFALTRRIRSTFDKGDEESQASLMRPLVEVPILVIDELGKGRGTGTATDWEMSVLDQLISRRYNAGRIVIATTNLKPERWLSSSKAKQGKDVSLEERVGRRVYSRLAEMCDFHLVSGPDFRASSNPATASG